MSDPNYLLRYADPLAYDVLCYRPIIDFCDYAAAAKYAIQINEGCNAWLIGLPPNPYADTTTEADAW